MRKLQIITISLMLLSIPAGLLHADDEADQLKKAEEMATKGMVDFAFMTYRSILKEFPDSEYIPEALFASGEYYFQNREYERSEEFFDNYINSVEKAHGGMLFALMYKMWLAEYKKDQKGYEHWMKEILAYRRQAYVFSDTKTYTYISPLKQEHRADYDIEEIKFFIEGQLFTAVTF